MNDINSNCVRVDFVAVLASQLKLQVAHAQTSIPPDEAQSRLQSRLDAVDQAVQSGDPQKAEQALFEAQSAARQIQIETVAVSTTSKSVDSYA